MYNFTDIQHLRAGNAAFAHLGQDILDRTQRFQTILDKFDSGLQIFRPRTGFFKVRMIDKLRSAEKIAEPSPKGRVQRTQGKISIFRAVKYTIRGHGRVMVT